MAESEDKMLKMYKKQLSAKLGWVTRISNLCTEIQSKDPCPIEVLKQRKAELETRFRNYEETFNLVEEYVVEKSLFQEHIELTDNFSQISSSYLTLLNSMDVTIVGSVSSGQSNPDNTGGIQSLKLPAITLPEFDGESNWFTFWDKFKGLVHERSDLTPVTKFSYLVGQLQGIALEVVRELNVTDDNYDVAVQLLKENFEDEEANIQRLVSKLIDLEGPKHAYQELMNFRITFSGLLKSLSVHKDLVESAWLINAIIQKKLGQKTLDELYHRYKKNYFSHQEIEEGIMSICKHLESMKDRASKDLVVKSSGPKRNINNPKTKQQTFVKQPSRVWHDRKGEVGTYVAQVKSPNRPDSQKESPVESGGAGKEFQLPVHLATSKDVKVKSKPASKGSGGKRSCTFCNGEHSSIYCPSYPNLWNRIQRLGVLNKCMVCMGAHQTVNCQVNLSNCFKCKKGLHHAALCPVPTVSKDAQANNL